MLAIRLQRRGRKGHAQFRVIVQEASLSPKSGRVVTSLGFYNPHTKETNLDKDEAQKYLDNGAQPSPRVVKLFQDQKIKLPKWVEVPPKMEKATKNPDKLRKNQPAEEEPEEAAPAEESAEEKPAEETAESAEEKAEEAPAEAKEEPAEEEKSE